MRVYLAGKYRQREFFQRIADQLEWCGIQVVSQWIYETVAKSKEELIGTGHGMDFAERDLVNIDCADMLVLDTWLLQQEETQGGMYVEFGYALAQGKRLVVIGPPTNVFTRLADVRRFHDWTSFMEWMYGISGRENPPAAEGPGSRVGDLEPPVGIREGVVSPEIPQTPGGIGTCLPDDAPDPEIRQVEHQKPSPSQLEPRVHQSWLPFGWGPHSQN
jgi:nucleoside 2-deoxyribosyltransferase